MSILCKVLIEQRKKTLYSKINCCQIILGAYMYTVSTCHNKLQQCSYCVPVPSDVKKRAFWICYIWSSFEAILGEKFPTPVYNRHYNKEDSGSKEEDFENITGKVTTKIKNESLNHTVDAFFAHHSSIQHWCLFCMAWSLKSIAKEHHFQYSTGSHGSWILRIRKWWKFVYQVHVQWMKIIPNIAFFIRIIGLAKQHNRREPASYLWWLCTSTCMKLQYALI